MGTDHDLCLDAFTVALSQTCEMDGWYGSTLQLQLASLQFCAVCRSVTTLSVGVDDHIPRRLLAIADAPSPDRKGLSPTRVPRLRARRVTWYLPTGAELRNQIYTFTEANAIHFGPTFDDTLDGIIWPGRLKAITFDECDSAFNQSIAGVAWPASLQEFAFGCDFNQPVEGVALPASLLQLTFGYLFNKPITKLDWPTSLLRITFGGNFDQSIVGVAWPDSVREICFGREFDQPIEEVTWPVSLQEVTFGELFNQPIERVAWPQSVRKLSFGPIFDQPIAEVRWPASLDELSFGGRKDDQSQRDKFYWASIFNQPLESTKWPASLRRVTFGHDFCQSLSALGTWMPYLEELCLLLEKRWACECLLEGIEWPKNLRKLTVSEYSTFEGVAVPNSVQVVEYSYTW